jgi:hypothetical protein
MHVGTGLKDQVEAIMCARKLHRLGGFQRDGLVLAAGEVLMGVLTLAFLFVRTACAAADDGSTISQQTLEARQNEQARPRTTVPYNPSDFDRYVGYYQLGPETFFQVMRNGSHCMVQLSGVSENEFYPDSAGEFFSKTGPVQVTFDLNADGAVMDLVLHQGGRLMLAKRVDAAVAARGQAALAARIQSNMPSPGTEAAVRHQIKALMKGQEDYSAMEPEVAAVARQQALQASQAFDRLGAFKSLTFKGASPVGYDIYEATFAQGKLEFFIAPLDPDGKIPGLIFRPPQS